VLLETNIGEMKGLQNKKGYLELKGLKTNTRKCLELFPRKFKVFPIKRSGRSKKGLIRHEVQITS
jgi:hypothetical protein